MKKSWILTVIVWAFSMSPSLAQDKVSAVHLSQAGSQALDEGNAKTSSNRSQAAKSSGLFSTGPAIHTNNLNRLWKNPNTGINGLYLNAGQGSQAKGKNIVPGASSIDSASSQAKSGAAFDNTKSDSSIFQSGSAQDQNKNGNNSNSQNYKNISQNNKAGGSAPFISGGTATASPAATMQAFIDNFPEIRSAADSSFGGMMIHAPGGSGTAGRLLNPTSTFMKAPISWPNMVPGGAAQLATTSVGAANNIPASIRNDGTGPVTATQMAAIASAAASYAATAPMMPDARLQSTKEELNATTQQQADNAADMEKQQAGSAIDYVRTALNNFTVDADNHWNQVRNQLFLPIAFLLLLPGAVAAQAKATVGAGIPIWSTDINPFEGLIRSIVAVFLIPATYLIVNYGIDLSNSIAYTIQSEYQQIFGTNMYRDAECAHIRAFGSRLPNENLGYIPNKVSQMAQNSSSVRGKFEQGNVDVKMEDPCAGVYNVSPDKANEQVPYAVNAQRAAYNGAGAALAMTWNILCAFQMCYLYYLWFVGPIMAALWVYPVSQLRSAFPNWCEGVITICFWSLFWNTVVLLMACFRGIDDTGTIITEALTFLSTACVKYAFDFAGLVKAAGYQAGKMAESAASSGKGSSGGSSSGSGSGSSSGGSKGSSGSGGSGSGKVAASDTHNSSPLAGNLFAASPSSTNSNAIEPGRLSPTNNGADDKMKTALDTAAAYAARASQTLPASANQGGNIDHSSSLPSSSGSIAADSVKIDPFTQLAPMNPVSPLNTANPDSKPGGIEDNARQQLQESEQERLKQNQKEKAEEQRLEQAKINASLHAGLGQNPHALHNEASPGAMHPQTAPLNAASDLASGNPAFLNAAGASSDSKTLDLIFGSNSANQSILPPVYSDLNFDPRVSEKGAQAAANSSQAQYQDLSDSAYARASLPDTRPTNQYSQASQDYLQLGQLYYDSSANLSRESAFSASNNLLNSSLPVPDSTDYSPNQYARLQNSAPDQDAGHSLTNTNEQHARFVDIPGNTEKVVLDSGIADASTQMARTSTAYEQAAYSSYAQSQSNSESSVWNQSQDQISSGERGMLAIAAASSMNNSPITANSPSTPYSDQTIYRQKQNTKIVEEKHRSQVPQAQKHEQSLKLNTANSDLAKRAKNAIGTSWHACVNQNGAVLPPPPQNADEKPPAGFLPESQALARASLAEQIVYRNILNKQRKHDEANAEEEELMHKLAHSNVSRGSDADKSISQSKPKHQISRLRKAMSASIQ